MSRAHVNETRAGNYPGKVSTCKLCMCVSPPKIRKKMTSLELMEQKGKKNSLNCAQFCRVLAGFPFWFCYQLCRFFSTKYFSVFFCCCCCRTEKIYFPSTIFLSFFYISRFFFDRLLSSEIFFLLFLVIPTSLNGREKILNYYRVTFRFPSFILFPLPRSYHHPSCDFLQYKKKSREIFPFSRSSFAFFSSVSIFFLKIGKVSSFTVARRLVCNIFRLNNIFNFVTLYFTLKWQ